MRGFGVGGGREVGGSAGAQRPRSPKLSSQCVLDPWTGLSSHPAAASAPWGRAWSRATRGRLHVSVSLSCPTGSQVSIKWQYSHSQSLSSLAPFCATIHTSIITEAPSRQRSSRAPLGSWFPAPPHPTDFPAPYSEGGLLSGLHAPGTGVGPNRDSSHTQASLHCQILEN